MRLPSPKVMRPTLRVSRWALFLSLLVVFVTGALAQGSSRVPLETLSSTAIASIRSADDLGPVPVSERFVLTLTLAPSAARSAALDRYLAQLDTPGSDAYRHWLTPAEFRTRFGADDAQIAAARTWLTAQGLTLESMSASGMRLSVSGYTPQVATAFGADLHLYQAAGKRYFAPVLEPSLPAEAAALFAAVDGLDDLPGNSLRSGDALVSLGSVASLVDENAIAVLPLDTVPASSFAAAAIAQYDLLFRQASAQGITVVSRRGLAALLPQVTGVALPGEGASASVPFAAIPFAPIPFAPRPAWQSAPGLPTDAWRHDPDLTVPSLAAFVQTLANLAAGGRLGNINGTLYALAPVAGLYTQADGSTGSWQAGTGLGLVDLARLQQVFPRGTAAASIQVGTATTTPMHGQPLVLTATLIGGNGVIPTGTVTFSSSQAGFGNSSANLDGSGKASSTAYLLPGGAYTVTGTYSGDATYAGASATTQFTVQPEAASFALTAPATVMLGNSFTATTTLTSPSGVGLPAATVTVTPAGISGGTALTRTLTGSGTSSSASFTFTPNQAGTVKLQAACTPTDQSFTCFTPQTATVTVPVAASTTALSINPTSPTAGTPIAFSATVSGITGTTPTGTVTFLDGTTTLGTGAAPNATYTGVLGAGSMHTLTASYGGDVNYNASTSNTVQVTVATTPTTTAVVASAATAIFGQTITVTATVKGSVTVNGTQPTGVLSYTLSGPTTSTAMAAVTGGVATIPLAGLAVGNYTLTSSYGGDASYSSSTGNAVSFTVTKATGALMAQFSSVSFSAGSTSTVTATVQLPGNTQLAAGSAFTAAVLDTAGTQVASYPGTFTLNAGGNSGTGAITLLAPPAGSYTVNVTCATNPSFVCNTVSQAITSTAAGTSLVATATTLSISPAAPMAGASIVFTATVTAAATAAQAISGTVTFLDGTTTLGTGTVTAGVASYTGTLTGTTASHSLTAVYGGDTVYAASTSAAVPVSLSAQAAGITLASNTGNSLAGQAITFTASVTGSTAAALVPTGTVSFYLTGTMPQLLGTSTLARAGANLALATLTTTSLPAGSQTIYAVYAGDANFTTVTSASITVGLGDYSVTFLPQSLTLARGKTGQATMILGIVNGFSGTVSFGCTPAPNTSITCSVSPAMLAGGGNSTLTIVTTAPTSAALLPSTPPVVGGIVSACLLGALLLGRGRRRLPALLLVLLALGLAVNLGCGGSVVATANGSDGTPFGTTTITINTAGSDAVGTLRHDFTFEVTVQ